MNTDKILAALAWAKALQLRAPVSPHHIAAVSQLWPLIEPLGIKSTLEMEIDAEQRYLLTKSERGNGD